MLSLLQSEEVAKDISLNSGRTTVFVLIKAIEFTGQLKVLDLFGSSERFNDRAGHFVAVFNG